MTSLPEPMKLGTVAVDEFDLQWVRVGADEYSSFEWMGALAGTRLAWHEVEAVRVLSEGSA